MPVCMNKHSKSFVAKKAKANIQPVVENPEFVRLPRVGQFEPRTGLTRSKLNSLILPSAANNFNPPVRSASVVPPGKTRGCRLVEWSSLLCYLKASVGPA
jgi:hypothetical protein